ncbi:MAG TPA: GNAT family N-acetyltransferase [Opitutaceae bacterium]|nr:GNAT family N-acetyltransferase [Opitutaceae bacterium]
MKKPNMAETNLSSLPSPPSTLCSEDVRLRFVAIKPADPARGFVPSYHFRIVTLDEADVGHISFRMGETDHIRICAGHIGFEIVEGKRGHGYALQACRAIAPFVGSVSGTVTITCDPDNLPSKRTIEHLGAHFIDEVPVPTNDPHYLRGSRTKLRFRWTP